MCIKIIMRLIFFLQLYMLLKNKVALRKIYSMRNFTSDCLEKLNCHAVSGKPFALLKCTQRILPSKLISQVEQRITRLCTWDLIEWYFVLIIAQSNNKWHIVMNTLKTHPCPGHWFCQHNPYPLCVGSSYRFQTIRLSIIFSRLYK